MFDNFPAWMSGAVIGPALLPPFANMVRRALVDNLAKNQALRDNLHPITSVKDGQLCWVSAGLLMTGFFEAIAEAVKRHGPDWITCGYFLLLLFLLFFNGMIFSEGAGDPTPWPGTSMRAMRKLWVSLYVLVVTVGCCFFIHYDGEFRALFRH